MKKCYFLFDEARSLSEGFESWVGVSKGFDLAVGYTFFGDLLLKSEKNNQYALLYNMPPELVDLDYFQEDKFVNEFLAHETVKKDFLQVDKVNEIDNLIGGLKVGEVYIPEPYPFMGGDCSVESYSKGDVFVFMDLIGQLQNE